MAKYYVVTGIFFMLLNNLALTSNDLCARILSKHLTSVQILFLAKLILFAVILPVAIFKGIKSIKTQEIKIHFLRSLFSLLGGVCFFTGLKGVPFADAAALENLQYVILSLFGVFLFKETFTKTKFASILFGIIGAICIAKHDVIYDMLYANGEKEFFSEPNHNYVYIFLAIFFWSLNSIVVKILGRTENTLNQTFYLMLFSIIFGLPGAVMTFESVPFMGANLYVIPTGLVDFSSINITIYDFALLCLMAFFYFVHASAYFNALKRPLTIVIPFRFTKFVFSAIVGYFAFSEVPQKMQLVGYFFIILSGLIMINREVRETRKRSKLAAE